MSSVLVAPRRAERYLVLSQPAVWGLPSTRCQESAGRAGPQPRLGAGAGAGTWPGGESPAPGSGGRVLTRPLARPRRPAVGARPSGRSAPSVVGCAVHAVFRPPRGRPPPGPTETRAPRGPGRVRGRRGSSPGPAPSPAPAPARAPSPPALPALALRSEGGPSRAPVPSGRDGRLQPRPELGRSRFRFLPRPRRLRCECGRAGSRGPPALPRSPPPRAHLTSRTGCRRRAGRRTARPSQLDGGGYGRGRRDLPGTPK